MFVANVQGISGINTAIYLWDALTGTNILVSANTNQALPTEALSDSPVISTNGRWVAFFSSAEDLVNPSPKGGVHLYLRDTQTQTTRLLDAAPNGPDGGINDFTVPAMDATGTRVAFDSPANNLVMNDRNRASDVFLRDANTETTELISAVHPLLPTRTPNGISALSTQPASRDGRHVVFDSVADDIVGGDTNQCGDVFVRDLLMGTNALVSVATDGTPGNYRSIEPVISASGRYVAFTSAATNFFASDANNQMDVFVRDTQLGTTTLVSVNTTGDAAGNKASYSPQISSDGRFILFVSKASNLATGPFSGTENLFVRDEQTATTYALTTAGLVGASMTPDGHFITFVDTAGSSSGKIYLWDAFVATRIATNSTSSSIKALSISPDGNRIAYYAGLNTPALSVWDRTAQSVTPIATGFPRSHSGLRFSADSRLLVYSIAPTVTGTNQVYRCDLATGLSTLVSLSTNAAAPGNGASDWPDISADGRFVVYRSAADDIVPDDNNGVPDTFLYDSATGASTILSASVFGSASGQNRSLAPVFSGDGRMLIFRSWASDLLSHDFNQSSDVVAFEFFYTELDGAADGTPRLTWPALNGQTFHLEYKDALNDSEWHVLPAPVTLTGNRASLVDPSPVSGHRFYRVVQDQ